MPSLRRAVMVALALLGQAPAPAASLEDSLDALARLLAETLSGGGTPADPSLAVAVRRLQHGRLLTALA